MLFDLGRVHPSDKIFHISEKVNSSVGIFSLSWGTLAQTSTFVIPFSCCVKLIRRRQNKMWTLTLWLEMLGLWQCLGQHAHLSDWVKDTTAKPFWLLDIYKTNLSREIQDIKPYLQQMFQEMENKQTNKQESTHFTIRLRGCKLMNNAVMKDTSLFNESDGCLQVLCHTKVQHDAWQPPPAGETRLMTCDHIQWLSVNTTCLWDDLPAERRGCDFLCEGQILFGGNETNTVPLVKKQWNYQCDIMILKSD